MSKETLLSVEPDAQSAATGLWSEGTSFRPAPSEKSDITPVLAHIHVPKTGGTSVVILLQQAGKPHVNLYVNDTHFMYSPDALAKNVLADYAIRSFSSHYVLTFPPYLAGRRMLYFTILRDPIQQFISYLTFIKKVFTKLRDPNLLACLPPDPLSLSLRDFACWLLSDERDFIPFRENYTVNFLARQVYKTLHGSQRQFDWSAYKAARLTLAKSVLDQFLFVGLTERMTESIDQLRYLAGTVGIDLPGAAIGNDNVSSEFRDDLGWIHPDDEVGAMLHKSVAEDQELYDWAVERFDSHFWSRRFELAAPR